MVTPVSQTLPGEQPIETSHLALVEYAELAIKFQPGLRLKSRVKLKLPITIRMQKGAFKLQAKFSQERL